MTQQDARERAWREQFHTQSPAPALWVKGWDAAKREDEQHIAALVAAIRDALTDWDAATPGLKAVTISAHLHGVPYVGPQTLGDRMEALRALAGQTEAGS